MAKVTKSPQPASPGGWAKPQAAAAGGSKVPLKGGGRRPGVEMPGNRYACCRSSAEGGSKSVDSAAQRRMSTVLPAWSEWTRSVRRGLWSRSAPQPEADRHRFPCWQRSRRRSGRGARSSLSRLATGQTGMSAGRNLMEWKSRRRDVPQRLEPSLSDEASAEEEGLDRF